MADMIAVKVDDKEITNHLERLSRKVRDLSPIMREISGDMLDAVQENFAREGRPNPWKKSKRTAKDSGKTLQDTTRLLKSITSTSDSTTAAVGTNVKYAAIHHFGGMAGRGKTVKIPARPYMMLDDSDARQIVDRMKRYLGE